jgi:AcrR family transcriptional regulator
MFNHMTKTSATAARRASKPASRGRRVRARPEKETQERILDAAERLFAERGIDAVSVRKVLAAAGVNVSLAHYHFGGRDGLIEALLRRRFGPITEERLRRIGDVEARGSAATLEDVLRAYHEHPSPRWLEEHPDFTRLLGQLQFSPNPRIRKIVRDVLRDAFAPLANAIASRLPPGLAPARWICRFYFVVGVGAYAAMSWDDMVRSTSKRFGPDVALDGRTLVDEIVRFCAAGLRASAEEGQT